MGKLHELIAVESTAAGNYARSIDETLKSLDRGDLFVKTTVSKEYFDAADAEKLNIVETKEITTTVKERLRWFAGPVIKYYDILVQKDATNQKAVADLEVNGVLIAKDVPATTLLALETKLQDIRKVISVAPTLQAGVLWDKDVSQGLWKAREAIVSFSSKKTAKPVVLYEATKEHPAQVKEVFEDVPVAKISKNTYSGMLTSEEKAKLLSRVDALLEASKIARQRANSTEVVKSEIGKNIVDYLFKDIVE